MRTLAPSDRPTVPPPHRIVPAMRKVHPNRKYRTAPVSMAMVPVTVMVDRPPIVPDSHRPEPHVMFEVGAAVNTDPLPYTEKESKLKEKGGALSSSAVKPRYVVHSACLRRCHERKIREG